MCSMPGLHPRSKHSFCFLPLIIETICNHSLPTAICNHLPLYKEKPGLYTHSPNKGSVLPQVGVYWASWGMILKKLNEYLIAWAISMITQ